MRLIFGILVLLPLLVSGQQNLVPNGSFENYSTCPWTYSQLDLANSWLTIGYPSSPDLYNECCSNNACRIPENGKGFQLPLSGQGYGGFYAYLSPVYPNHREYLQVSLLEPLIAGTLYEVVFNVSLADKFQYAVGSFGVFFSDTLVTTNSLNVLGVTPQISIVDSSGFTDKQQWTVIRDTFSSRFGGEIYMVIGNFNTDSESILTWVDSGASNTYDKSYYYIDDVSVVDLDTVSGIAEAEQLRFSVYPNPATGLVNIESKRHLKQVKLLDIRGREVATQQIISNKHTFSVEHVPKGVYFLKVTDAEGNTATQRLIKQ